MEYKLPTNFLKQKNTDNQVGKKLIESVWNWNHFLFMVENGRFAFERHEIGQKLSVRGLP